MKKPALYLIFLTPIIPRSANHPSVYLTHEPVEASIDSMLFLLFTAGLVFGCYTIFKKKQTLN